MTTTTEAGNGVEFTEAYLALEAMVVNHDTDAGAPLKKGEEPFRWSHVESEASRLLEQAMDLRVAIWLLRALVVQKGLEGLATGLASIESGLALPPQCIFPQPEPGENPRDAHAIALDWLGSPAFLAQVQQIIQASQTHGAPTTVEQRAHLQAAHASLAHIRQAIFDGEAHWRRDPVHALESLENAIRSTMHRRAAMPSASNAFTAGRNLRIDWPGNGAQRIRIILRSVDGRSELRQFEGPWALFRLFDSGRRRALGPDRHQTSHSLPLGSVTLEWQALSSPAPLWSNVLQTFTCPR